MPAEHNATVFVMNALTFGLKEIENMGNSNVRICSTFKEKYVTVAFSGNLSISNVVNANYVRYYLSTSLPIPILPIISEIPTTPIT